MTPDLPKANPKDLWPLRHLTWAITNHLTPPLPSPRVNCPNCSLYEAHIKIVTYSLPRRLICKNWSTTKFLNLVEILKFGQKPKIWLTFWNLVEILKFGWSSEISSKLLNLVNIVLSLLFLWVQGSYLWVQGGYLCYF